MTRMIAIAGKGGVGKTTCAALMLRALAAAGVRPLLAVDADPNANLHLLLGLPQPVGLGAVREEILSGAGGATSKEALLEAMVQQRVAEGKDVDLIAMGRGEGPGCYCYVNNLLRQSLSRLAGGYEAVVVDNEAGMEHLSRRNLRRIDHLVIVADPSPRGIAAARAIRGLADQLALPVGNAWVLLNRPYAAGETGEPLSLPAPLLAGIPHDPALPAWEAAGRSFLDLPDGAPAVRAISGGIRGMLREDVR
ncbi:MAG: carbon monoxide dehydrogenase [Deltaproteobacteria bacterium]|nr:MAG: carbon monoxide dehydrogenase [Deltaproteobacteria bacterium]